MAIYVNQDYLRNTPAALRPAIMQVRGFHKAMVMPDILHTLYLGVARFFLGSCLLELSALGVFGDPADLDAALGTALELHKTWRSAEGCGTCSLDTLSRANLGPTKEYPELPGKASDAKAMIPWMALMSTVHALGKGPYEAMYATAAWALAAFCDTLDNAGMWLTLEQRNAAFAHGDAFVQLYAALAREAYDRGHFQWCLRPKLHMLQHILESLKDWTVNMHCVCVGWPCN
jgi:hypothetical protein